MYCNYIVVDCIIILHYHIIDYILLWLCYITYIYKCVWVCFDRFNVSPLHTDEWHMSTRKLLVLTCINKSLLNRHYLSPCDKPDRPKPIIAFLSHQTYCGRNSPAESPKFPWGWISPPLRTSAFHNTFSICVKKGTNGCVTELIYYQSSIKSSHLVALSVSKS